MCYVLTCKCTQISSVHPSICETLPASLWQDSSLHHIGPNEMHPSGSDLLHQLLHSARTQLQENKEHFKQEIILIPIQVQLKHTNYLIPKDGTQSFADQWQKCYLQLIWSNSHNHNDFSVVVSTLCYISRRCQVWILTYKLLILNGNMLEYCNWKKCLNL